MASMLTDLENEDSYSLATKARIEDILDKFIEDLEEKEALMEKRNGRNKTTNKS